MKFLWYSIVFFVAYLCIFVLVDRICRCVEHCVNSKSLAKSLQNLGDLEKTRKILEDMASENQNKE